MRKITRIVIVLAVLTVASGADGGRALLAAGSPAFSWSAHAQSIDDLIQSYRFDEARTAIGPVDDGSPPALRFLDLELHYYQGDYTYVLSHGGRLTGTISHQGIEDYAGFLKSTSRLLAATKIKTFGNISIRYTDDRDTILFGPLVDAARRQLKALGPIFGLVDPGGEKIRIEIYDDIDSFAAATTLTVHDVENSGVAGISKFGKLLLVTPRVSARGYPYLDIIMHELVHYILIKTSHNVAPLWFHEGSAKYFEQAFRGVYGAMSPLMYGRLYSAMRTGRLIPISMMEPSFVKMKNPADIDVAYAEVEMLVKYFIELRGLAAYSACIASMRETGNFDLSFKRVYGVEYRNVFDNLRSYLARVRFPKDIERYTRIAEDEIRFTGRTGDERLRLVNNRELALTYLLEKKGRSSEARYELGKAYEKMPYEIIVIHKYALSLIAADDFSTARKILDRALGLYPNVSLFTLDMATLSYRMHDRSGAAPYVEATKLINPFNPVLGKIEAWLKKGP